MVAYSSASIVTVQLAVPSITIVVSSRLMIDIDRRSLCFLANQLLKFEALNSASTNDADPLPQGVLYRLGSGSKEISVQYNRSVYVYYER